MAGWNTEYREAAIFSSPGSNCLAGKKKGNARATLITPTAFKALVELYILASLPKKPVNGKRKSKNACLHSSLRLEMADKKIDLSFIILSRKERDRPRLALGMEKHDFSFPNT